MSGSVTVDDARFSAPYADWGKCELCKAKVPPSGARIEFFGRWTPSLAGAEAASRNQVMRPSGRLGFHCRGRGPAAFCPADPWG